MHAVKALCTDIRDLVIKVPQVSNLGVILIKNSISYTLDVMDWVRFPTLRRGVMAAHCKSLFDFGEK